MTMQTMARMEADILQTAFRWTVVLGGLALVLRVPVSRRTSLLDGVINWGTCGDFAYSCSRSEEGR
jgi:hypothetical protein